MSCDAYWFTGRYFTTARSLSKLFSVPKLHTLSKCMTLFHQDSTNQPMSIPSWYNIRSDGTQRMLSDQVVSSLMYEHRFIYICVCVYIYIEISIIILNNYNNNSDGSECCNHGRMPVGCRHNRSLLMRLNMRHICYILRGQFTEWKSI